MPVTTVGIEILLLVVALSLDAFVASFAYGTDNIKIPFSSFAVLNFICTLFFAVSLILGDILTPHLPPHFTRYLCCFLLAVLGLVKLFDSTIKGYIRKQHKLFKKINFKLFQVNFILTVYADPQKADSDKSRNLSAGEALSLAVALSLDGLAVGFSAGLGTIPLWQAIVFSLLGNMLAIWAGSFTGRVVAKKTSLDLSWLSGVLLIVLAVLKVV